MEVFLYEYSLDWAHNFDKGIPVVILFAVFFFVVFIKNRKRRKLSLSALALSILCLSIQLVNVVVFINNYNDLSKKYQEGNYLTVEGYVENYSVEPTQGHSPETFEIGGIKFQTSEYIHKLGYNRTNNSKGVIRNNKKQYLKVYYLEDLVYEKEDFRRYIILAIIEVATPIES